jgi:uncharacterized protein YqiB (DUF1249 family)
MILATNADLWARLQNAPGTFAGLMDLYERNYIGIRRLVPVLPPAHTPCVSQVPGGLSLHLQVLDAFRYTTELSLTYYFRREQSNVAEPDLRIRIYHDARLAEVMAAQLRQRPEFQVTEQEWQQTPLLARWHVNRFLYKWLNYCLYQGHRFGDTR